MYDMADMVQADTATLAGDDLSISFGPGRLSSQAGPRSLLQIPPDLCTALAPAVCCLREWTDYWVEYPGANRLRVGDCWLTPVAHAGLFRLRFENALGLTAIRPFHDHHPAGEALYVEVISGKFPSPDAHLSFFRALLQDLFLRSARLPFAFSTLTARAVEDAATPPTPLFVFHFLLHHAPLLQAALELIQKEPHRELHEDDELVPLTQVTEVDADVLLSIMRAPDRWRNVINGGFPLAQKLGGYAPTHAWQRKAQETVDTPENRFVLAFVRQLLAATESLIGQAWWTSVSSERRHVVQRMTTLLRHAIRLAPLEGVGSLQHFPWASQALQHREGYRDVLHLWQTFQHARRPFFGQLQHAIDVRDIAQLYEMWVFFALTDAITAFLERTPHMDLRASDESGLGWGAEASFGVAGTLVYNGTQHSYSVPLRPDFAWIQGNRLEVVLDAKFRLDRRALDDATDDTPTATAKRADLYKMHTYRDALGVRAAVCVYPGDESVFYSHDRRRDRRTPVTVRDLLEGGLSGVGALALGPGARDQETLP